MLESSPYIIEGTEANFQTDVLERSKSVPVVVDFWAPWCAPCRQLTPLLEQAARDGDGKFVLVKVNVDEQQNVAMAFRVQSIPAVFALRDGQLLDQFEGVLPPDQLAQWLDSLLPSQEEQLLDQAIALEAKSPRDAEEKYREVLESEPKNDAARVGLARVLVRQHRDAESRAIIVELEKRGFLEPEAENVKAELDVRAAAVEAGDVGKCRADLAANPNDAGLKLKLAESLAAVEQYPEALDLCLQVVQTDFGEFRESARTEMVNLFHILGNQSELTQTYRRKLATALY